MAAARVAAHNQKQQELAQQQQALVTVAATVPTGNKVFTEENHAEFDQILSKYALCIDPWQYIENGWTLKGKRRDICAAMASLYNATNKDDWPVHTVPANCNVQSYLATEGLLRIFRRRNSINDDMLALLVAFPFLLKI